MVARTVNEHKGQSLRNSLWTSRLGFLVADPHDTGLDCFETKV